VNGGNFIMDPRVQPEDDLKGRSDFGMKEFADFQEVITMPSAIPSAPFGRYGREFRGTVYLAWPAQVTAHGILENTLQNHVQYLGKSCT